MPGIIWYEMNIFVPEIYAELSADMGENREPAMITDAKGLLTSGDQLNDFYNDRVPFRSLIIKINQKATEIIEKPYNEHISPKLMAWFKPKQNTPEPEPENKDVLVNVDIDVFGDDTPDTENSATDLPTISISDAEASVPPEEGDEETDAPNECEHNWIENKKFHLHGRGNSSILLCHLCRRKNLYN